MPSKIWPTSGLRAWGSGSPISSIRETSKRAEESEVEDEGSASGSAVGRAPEERRAAAMSRNLEAESAREERQEA